MSKYVPDSVKTNRQACAFHNPAGFLHNLLSKVTITSGIRVRNAELLAWFYPPRVNEKINAKSRSYQTHFLSCSAENPVRNEEYYDMTAQDVFAMVEDTATQVVAFFFREDVQYDAQEIRRWLSAFKQEEVPAFTWSGGDALTDALRNSVLHDWQRCIAKLIVTLSMGAFATAELVSTIWLNYEKDLPLSDKAIDKRAAVSDRYEDALYKHRHGNKSSAVQSMIGMARKAAPADAEQVQILYMAGKWLFEGDGCRRDIPQALRWMEKACESPDVIYAPAHFFMAQIYRDGYPQCGQQFAQDAAKAGQHLVTAAEAGLVDAMQEYAVALFTADASLGIERDPEKAFDLLKKAAGQTTSKAQRATIYYYCGRIMEEIEPESAEEAMYWYNQSAALGDSDAKKKVHAMRWMTWKKQSAPVDFALPAGGNLFVSNGSDGQNGIFRDSLPEQDAWSVTILADPQRHDALQRLGETMLAAFQQPKDACPIVTAAFLSEDAEFNLQCTVDLLAVLYEQVALPLTSRESRMTLMENVTIFLRADSAYASLVVDAILSAMDEGIYFKTVFCDYPLDSVRQLLTRHPLFLPCIDHREDGIRVAILGGETIGVPMIREIMACVNGCVGTTLDVKLISEHADRLQREFYYECPGVRPDRAGRTDEHTASLTFPIQFVQMDDVRSANLLDAVALGDVNYFIVDVGTDEENLLFATRLRGWLLKTDARFSRMPEIAVLCRSSKTASFSQAYTVGSLEPGYEWFNSYNLYTFGAADTMYTFASLYTDALTYRAQAAHCDYALKSAQDESGEYIRETVHNSLKDYYSRYYFRDSSMAEVVSLIYRLFAVDIVHVDPLSYEADRHAALAQAFANWIASDHDAKCVTLGQNEHARWCSFMLSRGWERAEPDQMEAYLRMGNPKQQCFVCRLHPYICPWDALEKTRERLQRRIKAPELQKLLADPKGYDIGSVQKTGDLIGRSTSVLAD